MTVLDAFDLAVCDDAELGRRAAAGEAQARRELIERYVPLARRLALRHRRPGEAPDDLIQVASLASSRSSTAGTRRWGTCSPRTPCRRSSASCADTSGTRRG